MRFSVRFVAAISQGFRTCLKLDATFLRQKLHQVAATKIARVNGPVNKPFVWRCSRCRRRCGLLKLRNNTFLMPDYTGDFCRGNSMQFLSHLYKLQLQNRTCKPGAIFSAICRRDVAGVSSTFETWCNFAATKIACSCCDKNCLCKRALTIWRQLRGPLYFKLTNLLSSHLYHSLLPCVLHSNLK